MKPSVRYQWWHFLNTEEGRDQTLAHAMAKGALSSICGVTLEHIGADLADEEYMEPEEYCAECSATVNSAMVKR